MRLGGQTPPVCLACTRTGHLSHLGGVCELHLGHLPLELVDTGGATRELAVSVDAGDVLLFKYADGQPFARRAP